MFLRTIDSSEASGRVAEILRGAIEARGFVMQATACWTARPDLLPAWEDFFGIVRKGFSLSDRDWRLITFVAAQEVPSTYCSFVYGRQLIEDLGSREAVMALQADLRSAGLDERELAMLSYARKVARKASEVTVDDVDALRAAGFDDTQICDIALCASLRCFMARFFDATGAAPEDSFADADPRFRAALTVGREPGAR